LEKGGAELFRQAKRINNLKKELARLERTEEKLRLAAMDGASPSWKKQLEKHLPEKVYAGIESAFCKAFSLTFEQGRGIIEKSYDKETLSADHSIRDYAISVKGGRREIRSISKSASRAGLINLAVTTIEGIGLGALGIGLPDIVLFISTLLKGTYETAINYGFGYESRKDQYIILKMLSVPLKNSEDWAYSDLEIDRLMQDGAGDISEEDFATQMKSTASDFALDMLALKFLQGIPVIGLFAGAANPVYYRKISKYVNLKYQKHYYLKKLREAEGAVDTILR